MLVFPSRLSFAQMIQAKIGDDAVNPGVEGALEAKVDDVPVSFEEGFLVDILCVRFGVGEMQRQAKDRLVVLPDKRLKRSSVTALRGTNQIAVIQSALGLAHSGSR